MQMAPLATGAGSGDVAAGPAPGTAMFLDTLTIPGCPEHVATARSFVAAALGDWPQADVAVLLTSETVTNAVLHSDSSRPGGTVTVAVTACGGGVRVEVSDAGSADTVPVVRDSGCTAGGHGLRLVQQLASHWDYVRDASGTTVWFWIGPQG